jgi:hypothetical protein
MTSSTGELAIQTRRFLLRLVRSSFQKVFRVCRLRPAAAAGVAVVAMRLAAVAVAAAQLTILCASLWPSRLARR